MSSRKSIVAVFALSAGLAGSFVPSAWAGPFTFTKIVDTDTGLPGGAGEFSAFLAPSQEEGTVAFVALGTLGQGVYIGDGGGVTTVADESTLIPGEAVTFTSFDPPSLSNGAVAFRGRGGLGLQGIYTNAGGGLSTLVDADTELPDSTTEFDSFGGVSFDNGTVAFAGGGGAQAGVYTSDGNSVELVADLDTALPGAVVAPSSLGSPSLDGGAVAFSSQFGFGSGAVYFKQGQGILTIANDSTTVPGGMGSFRAADGPSLDDGEVAFFGNDSSFRGGIYMGSGGDPEVVADQNTAVPGGSGNFFSFVSQSPSLDAGNVAFTGSGSGVSLGIFTTLGGELTDVITTNDELDGKTISTVTLSGEGLDGDQIAFGVRFSDDSQAIYLATLSIPDVSGDANGDGKVDAADLNILALSWQESVAASTGADFTGDGFVDAADLNELALNWQFGVSGVDEISEAIKASAAVVPEPGVATLIVGLLSLLATRRVG